MKLILKSVNELLKYKYKFFIPSYQRGYRWGDIEVKNLLEDIYDFSIQKKEGFYCLQPIVVRKDRNNYRVIDGQQRLTTIYILLKFLEKKRILEEDFDINSLYSIEYETRKESKDFLENNLYNINKNNPDFYYMSKAYQTIENWFKEKRNHKKRITGRKFAEILLGADDLDVKFIWYELAEDDNEIEVFTRLNIGKIPLSNSELIKAIILQDLNENEKSEIIAEWDYIEKNLQNDRFFSFLTKKECENTRIDFIFELIAKKYNKEKYEKKFKENDERFSFYVFNELIKNNEISKKELWKKVKEYFRIFEELYNENRYYHYVGYLTNLGIEIEEIVNIFKTNKKNDFKEKLEEKIKIKINKPLKKLNYEEDKKELYKLLYLFNVLITMESGYSKYPFDIHNKEKWSLEHIHARNSEDIKEKDREELLNLQLQSNYIEDTIKQEIEILLKNGKARDKNEFEKIQKKIYQQFTDEKEDIDTIDNLTLLSKEDNSTLSNSIFPEKRAKIKELDEKGKFIPLGTKNVFMKYYSNEMKNFLKWDSNDRKAYLDILEKKLNRFIKVEK
jgi:uncharacterized protein with ParB-like and HNH nuclease domain